MSLTSCEICGRTTEASEGPCGESRRSFCGKDDCKPKQHDQELDVWIYETQHSDQPFICRCGDLMLDHVKESLDDWMRSPIGNGEQLEMTVTYRTLTKDKFKEWQDLGLVS